MLISNISCIYTRNSRTERIYTVISEKQTTSENEILYFVNVKNNRDLIIFDTINEKEFEVGNTVSLLVITDELGNKKYFYKNI